MMLKASHEDFGFATTKEWCREGFGGFYVADGVAWLSETLLATAMAV